jgi:hypothetical protein
MWARMWAHPPMASTPAPQWLNDTNQLAAALATTT